MKLLQVGGDESWFVEIGSQESVVEVGWRRVWRRRPPRIYPLALRCRRKDRSVGHVRSVCVCVCVCSEGIYTFVHFV